MAVMTREALLSSQAGRKQGYGQTAIQGSLGAEHTAHGHRGEEGSKQFRLDVHIGCEMGAKLFVARRAISP